MTRSPIAPVVLFCAAVQAFATKPASDQFHQPTCPTVQDQTIAVAADQATAFTVGVSNLGSGYVTIFQYPLGGSLLPSGQSPLDFVFTPDIGFTGTTTFVYRVTPETGCRQGALLGRVNLVGPTTGRTFVAPEAGACGVGTVTALALAGSALISAIGARLFASRYAKQLGE
jgi:hypothetical protein